MFRTAYSKNAGALRALAVFGALAAPTAAISGEVSLRSSDGTINVVGEFVSFENNTYTVRTGLGDLQVSAERVSCAGAACPAFDLSKAGVVISGSDTVGLALMPMVLEGLAAHLDAELIRTATPTEGEIFAELIGEQGFGDPIGSYLVTSTVSGDAFKRLLDGSTELGMASRRIRPAEARALRDAGAGNMISQSQEHIVAVDSLAVVVHPDNPIQSLRMDHLAGIYSGQITNWSEVGGNDAPIRVLERPDGSGTRSLFAEIVLGDGSPSAPGAEIISQSEQVSIAVTKDPNAIGYVGVAFQRDAKALPLINQCGLTMTPDQFSARTEEYQLQRRLYIYNRADELSTGSRELLDYIQSPDADEVIQKAGFISLNIEERAQSLDSARALKLLDPNVDAYESAVMREMLETMADYDRLSTTFRFRTGSSRMDERALLDMSRLVDYLENKPTGTKVLFVGFTDDMGAFDSNRDLSLRRASQVMEELQSYAGDRLSSLEIEATGFGEIAPSACNLDERGREINRRVEVWVSTAGLL